MSFSQQCHISGISLEVEWDHASLSDLVTETLSYFGFTPPETNTPALHLQFLACAPLLQVPAESKLLSETPEGLQFYRADALLYLHFRGTVVCIDPQRGTAYATFGTEGAAAGPLAPTALRDSLFFGLFFYSLVLLLYARGKHTLHAACLAWQGQGFLFAGQSDSGKSTLSIRLIEQGWQYLTDDSVLLGKGETGIEARPLRHDFCLDPDAALLFPQVAGHWQPHLGDPRKQRLRIRELYPEQAALCCVPRTIVFPRIAPESESRLVPLDQKDTLLRLLQHGGAFSLLGSAAATVHLDNLKALAAQARGYLLHAGRDLRDHPQAATLLMQRLLI